MFREKKIAIHVQNTNGDKGMNLFDYLIVVILRLQPEFLQNSHLHRCSQILQSPAFHNW